MKGNGVIIFLLIFSVMTKAAESSGGERNAYSVCGTPRFHEQTKYLARNFDLKTECKLLGKVGASGEVLEENVSDVREFWTIDYDGDSWSYKKVNATLRNKTASAYVYVALKEPSGNDVWFNGSNNGYITQEDVNEITQVFDDALSDENIYSRNRLYFGEERPTGVDGDPHVTLLLLDIDGDQGDGFSGGVYTGGYFHSLNEDVGGNSNKRKMIFIDTFPNIDWKSGGIVWTPDRFHDAPYEGANQSYGVIAHEFEHMIHWWHDSEEETWVDEGCADYAQFINGLGHPEVHVSAFEGIPDTQLNRWDGALKDYGAAYLWTLYFSEHFGGNQTVKVLVNDSARGIAGINATLSSRGYNTSFQETLPYWIIANYVDDTSLSNGEFGYAHINLSMNLTASKTSYPASDSDSVKTYAGDYVLFSNGNGSILNLSFDGQNGRDLSAYIVKINSTSKAVEEILLNSNNNGETTVNSFGSVYPNVTLVVIGKSTGGNYSYTADVVTISQPEGWLKTYLFTPNNSTEVTKNSLFNLTSGVQCIGGVCGNVTATLNSSSGTVPEGNGTPFYTIDLNPRYPENLSCLVNMTENSSCNITWRINATGNTRAVFELYVVYSNNISSNQTEHINATIIPAPTLTHSEVVNATANETVNVSAFQANVTLGIMSRENILNVQFTINHFNETPTFADFTFASLGKFIEVDSSPDISGNLTYAYLKVHYTEEEINQSNLNESTLALYWYNTTASIWQILTENMSWVYGTGLNETEDFVWANLTHYSLYAIGGESLTTPYTENLVLGWNLISIPINL